MATLLAPYNTAMQLGSGFNSFNQQLCIDRAVEKDPELAAALAKQDIGVVKEIAQRVTYSTSVIDKTTDVTDKMDIKGGFAVKYDTLNVAGSGQFINTNKIKESDVTIMVSVKVVNQVVYDHSLVNFKPISGVKDLTPARLVEIYGDCFISGFQEGGEFLAIISIKAKNRTDSRDIEARAKIEFTKAKPAAIVDGKEVEGDQAKAKKKFEAELSLDQFNKNSRSITDENEVSINVTWTGGGQHIKPPEKDWDFQTMKEVALRFPDLVAKTPMRTHALLTKYTALRSFYSANIFDLPLYEKTGTYSSLLQEAYLDYKAIQSQLQILAFDVSEGAKRLIINPRQLVKPIEQDSAPPATTSKKEETSHGKHSDSTDDESIVNVEEPATRKQLASAKDTPVVSKAQQVVIQKPLIVTEPYAPTIEGLEEARLHCRFMMNRIIQEIDNVAIKPEIAVDETRVLPYMSPFLFKQFLPIGEAVQIQATAAEQAKFAAVEEGGPDTEAIVAGMKMG